MMQKIGPKIDWIVHIRTAHTKVKDQKSEMGFKKNEYFVLHLAKITSIFFYLKLFWNIVLRKGLTKYSEFNRFSKFLAAIYIAGEFYSSLLYSRCQFYIIYNICIYIISEERERET